MPSPPRPLPETGRHAALNHWLNELLAYVTSLAPRQSVGVLTSHTSIGVLREAQGGGEGTAKIQWRGDWNADTSYAANDIVIDRDPGAVANVRRAGTFIAVKSVAAGQPRPIEPGSELNWETFARAGWDRFVVHERTNFGVDSKLAAGGQLTIGTRYFYRVEAVGAAGAAVSEEVSEVPEAGKQRIVITWSAIDGATAYRVYRTKQSGDYVSPSLVAQFSGTTCTDSGGTLDAGIPPDAASIYLDSGKCIGWDGVRRRVYMRELPYCEDGIEKRILLPASATYPAP